MTQEKKKLLFIDLCGRLPYHPKGKVVNNKTGAECDEWLTCATFNMFTSINNNCRLYLRPMSSMTEEEWLEWQNIKTTDWVTECINAIFVNAGLITDWLNKKMFDFRGLIPLGLALEAKEGMYGKEEEK